MKSTPKSSYSMGKLRKFSIATANSDHLFGPNHKVASSVPTALDSSFDHYQKNEMKSEPEEVIYSVPFPTKCPECEYQGFTEIQMNETCCSKTLKVPVILSFGLCWAFGTCQETRQNCLDEVKDIEHKCYNCKSLIATKKSILRRRTIMSRSYT